MPYLAFEKARAHIYTNYTQFEFPVEGKAFVVSFALVAAASCVLCVAGISAGLAAYTRLPRPRAPARILELVLLALPIPLWVIFALPLFGWMLRAD